MKDYIQFYHKSTGYNTNTGKCDGTFLNISICGSDGIQYFDKRHNLENILRYMTVPRNCTGYVVIRHGIRKCERFFNDLKTQY